MFKSKVENKLIFIYKLILNIINNDNIKYNFKNKMAKRTKKGQHRHDNAVLKEVLKYKRKGYRVKADLPGHQRPGSIGKRGHVPDIVATKPGTRHIVEIETKDSYALDKEQLATFRRSAAQRNRTKFRVMVV